MKVWIIVLNCYNYSMDWTVVEHYTETSPIANDFFFSKRVSQKKLSKFGNVHVINTRSTKRFEPGKYLINRFRQKCNNVFCITHEIFQWLSVKEKYFPMHKRLHPLLWAYIIQCKNNATKKSFSRGTFNIQRRSG